MNIIKYDVKLSSLKFTELWGARSESNPNRIYTVALNKKGEWSCGCPRWTKNASRPECKHIKYIKEFRQRRGGIRVETEIPEQVAKAAGRFSAVDV